MKHTAIPTEYKGVRFRSRLEAKWAAFFDLCEWPWEFEPLDLDGYIPDFILRFSRPILVEIKPLMFDDGMDDPYMLTHAMGKAEHSGWDGEILILGSVVSPCFGVIRDPSAGWGPASPFRCHDCGHFSLLAENSAWTCRVRGCEVGRRVRYMNAWDVVADFRRASNATQWKAA